MTDISQAIQEWRPEITLADLGVGVDVSALRLDDIPPMVAQRILDAYPRLGFKQAFLQVCEDEARTHPSSRIAVLLRHGLGERMCQAPFAE
ncbi:MAG: hypothetical protein ABI068_04500 [Ktedonobacterales bacterium]